MYNETPPLDVDLARETDRPVTRQVQVEGRRHAISIEPVYWSILEDASRATGIRLNRLVKTVAAAPAGPDNLAARLRLFCVRWQGRRLRELENAPPTVDLARIIDAAPGPCFALSRDLAIVWHNPPLRTWLGLTPAELAAMPFARHFRLRLSRPLTEVWREFSGASAGIETGSLTCLLPGRLLARPVSVCPVALPGPRVFLGLVFVR